MLTILKKNILLGVGITALIVRILYFSQHVLSPFFSRPLLDQHYYDLCARQLVGAGGNLIDGFRPLLYPIFLSLFYRLDLDSGLLLSLVAQHLLGIGMAVMVARLAMRMFENAKAGVIAGLLFCFSAPPLYFEGELLITTLFSFLLLLLWMAVSRALENREPRRAAPLWITSGIVLGLASQARPNALPLLLAFSLVALFRLKNRRASASIPQAARQPAWHPLLAILGLLLVQTLFGFLNAKYNGHFSLMTQAGGINFYLGNSQKADGMIPLQSEHVVYQGEYRDPIQVMAEQGYRDASGTSGEISPKEVSNYWKQKTLEEIHKDPARWIELMAKKTWLMFWNHEVPNNRSFSFAAKEETPILNWLPIRWWFLLALFPWGIAALHRKGQTERILWITTFIVLFSGTVVLFFVNSRFRIPLWPGMAVMGGGGAIYFWTSLKARKARLIPIFCSGVLLFFSGINWFHIPPDPIENDLSMRANALYEQGRYEKAKHDIEACLVITSNNPRYHFILGNILLAQKEPAAAIQSYLKAISLNPADPMFHNNLGIAFENAGNPNQALVAYRKALKLQPNHRAAKTNFLLLAIQTNRFELANNILQGISSEDRRNATLQCAISMLRYKETGDQFSLMSAMQINPTLAEQLLPKKEITH